MLIKKLTFNTVSVVLQKVTLMFHCRALPCQVHQIVHKTGKVIAKNITKPTSKMHIIIQGSHTSHLGYIILLQYKSKLRTA